MLDRLINAARDADTAPTPSSGARLRSRQVLRLFAGQPIRVKQTKASGAAKGGRPPLPQMSRAERLEARNARKQAQVLDASQPSPSSELIREEEHEKMSEMLTNTSKGSGEGGGGAEQGEAERDERERETCVCEEGFGESDCNMPEEERDQDTLLV